MSAKKIYPIILAHGIARFDFLTDSLSRKVNLFLWDLSLALDRLHYFKSIATHLRREGFTVYLTSVSFAASVETRARELCQQVLQIIEETGCEKAHIIGHSMGGLDARHMIVHENMADKVATLTTIGTPHLGTSFADWGLTHGGDQAIRALRPILDLEGFLTLTIEARHQFNESARNQEATNGVIYQVYASAQTPESIFRPLRASWQIIHDNEGSNDGLVSMKSQQWVEKLVSDTGVVKTIKQHEFPLPADHLNQIGWWDLEELSKLNWWKYNMVIEKRRYEAAIRDVYLKIATE